MSNELTYDRGISFAIQYVLADVAKNGTRALALPNGNAGYKVPTGYKFHSLALFIGSDTDLTAGTITGKVTRDGVVLTTGPQPALSDTVQAATGVSRHSTDPIIADAIVGVSAVASSDLAPDATCGLDAILIGILLPA